MFVCFCSHYDTEHENGVCLTCADNGCTCPKFEKDEVSTDEVRQQVRGKRKILFGHRPKTRKLA